MYLTQISVFGNGPRMFIATVSGVHLGEAAVTFVNTLEFVNIVDENVVPQHGCSRYAPCEAGNATFLLCRTFVFLQGA